MSEACSSGPGGAIRRNPAAFGPADWLAVAASPTFALMAVLTTVLGGNSMDMPCSASPVSPLSGMAMMYLLMSAFHLGAWLRLVRGGR
ncbi:hypothetical protein ACMDCR_29330 [Labrys okinawensis]|uniref:hypothetical protein n=1 Tax=Labrys okinawensis TaxID=346911 RepID=UPI0039BD68EE